MRVLKGQMLETGKRSRQTVQKPNGELKQIRERLAIRSNVRQIKICRTQSNQSTPYKIKPVLEVDDRANFGFAFTM